MIRAIIILGLCAGCVLPWAGRAQAQPRRLWVSVEPNALERREDGMLVRVLYAGAADGTQVTLRILADCNGDGSPDERDEVCQGKGKAVLRTFGGVLKDGRIDQHIALDGLPEGERLWVRAGEGQEADDAFFFISRDPCTVWRTVLDAFARGGCRLGVLDALEQLMGEANERPDETLEVRRLNPSTGAMAAVPGTRGATGVAWAGPSAVLVTLGRTDQARAGLYRVEVKTGKAVRLWAAEEGMTPVAPLDAGGRVLLVLEKERIEADGVVGWLGELQGRRMVRRTPLRRTVHQILAVQGDRILLYSRWQGRPEFVVVDLGSGTETRLGRAGVLLDALYRSPTGDRTVWAEPDRANDTGWDLWILEGPGKKPRPLLRRPQHDLMPAWSPDGKEIAYLGEVAQAAGRR